MEHEIEEKKEGEQLQREIEKAKYLELRRDRKETHLELLKKTGKWKDTTVVPWPDLLVDLWAGLLVDL